ncbi:CCA tRNA nucleotidyltransferase [Candidatus Woesearchaeota archaeon B3_Woes]|nr:MAG: CCA tRNA nucleotidyltransferase [Candidatus Woesearchaeota archaeon B3_Woes]
MDVLKEVLKDVKPKEEDEILIDKKIKDFMSRIKVKDAKIILGGSGAKSTWLKTANDADIFVQFNYNQYKDKSDKLSDILEKQLKKSFKKINRLHGSRDYFQIIEKGFTFEIIPIIEIKKANKALNITDVSPLHAIFVKKCINKKLADEIRLMKQFCKANKIYGAESYINGFSGYMCELLVINYNGFLKLLKAASKWKDKEVIDIKKFYKGKNIFLEMNKSKTYSPIIMVDPVQKDRNAAAALSFEKFDIFRKKAKEFLKKPSTKFFQEKEFDPTKLKDYIIVEIKPIKGKQDVVGAKLLKTFNFLKKELSKEGFKIQKQGWDWDKGKKAHFYFKIIKDVDKLKIIEGPSTTIKEHVLNFKKKHKTTFTKNKQIFAKEKRKITKPKDYVKELLKKDYVKERVKETNLK